MNLKKTVTIFVLLLISLFLFGCSSSKEAYVVNANELDKVEDIKEEVTIKDSITEVKETIPDSLDLSLYYETTPLYGDEYDEKILSNLKAPEGVVIKSLEYSPEAVYSFFYTFNLDKDIRKLCKVTDKTDSFRYEVFTIARTNINGNDLYEEFKSSIYGCENEVINEGNLGHFYEGMFDSDFSEGYVYEGYLRNTEIEDGYEAFCFDRTNDFISIQVKYLILDTKTGKIYESPYSDSVSFGKGYEITSDDPIESIDVSPLLVDCEKRYTLGYISNIIYPYFMVSFKDSDEIRELACNNSGYITLVVEVKNNSGEFEKANEINAQYASDSDFIYLFMPCKDEEVEVNYDMHNLVIRARYEFYLNDTYNCDPYAASEYSYYELCYEER